MNLRQPFTLIFLLCFASSCMRIGPVFERPESCVQEEWLGMDASEELGESDWWRILNDPVLDALIAMTLKQNLGLEVAAVRIQAAKAELGVARGFLYPQEQHLSGSYTSTRLSKNTPPISDLPAEFKDLFPVTRELYTAGFEAMWELDIWGRFRKGIDAAAAELCATVFDQHTIVVSLLAEVANSYLLVREGQEVLRVIEENIAIQERNLEIAMVRFENGVVSELDVHQAKTILANTKAEGEEVKRAISRARHALAVLLAVPPACLPEALYAYGTVPDAPESLALGIPCDLLRRRPDLRALELRAYAQSERIGIAKTDLLPHFSLFGSIGLQSDDPSKWFQSASTASKLTPGFQWDIFHYGRLVNRVRIQDARLQELILTYQEAVLKAQAEVEDGIADFYYSQQANRFFAEGSAAAKRAVSVVQLQYREGIVDFTPLLVAQEIQLGQERRYVRSRGGIIRGLISIYRNLGGGWELYQSDHLSEETAQQMRCRTNWGKLLDVEVESCGWSEQAGCGVCDEEF